MAGHKTIYVFSDNKLVRVVRPRNDKGHWQGDDEASDNPLARRSSDVMAEATGILGSSNRWNARWLPSVTPVAETMAEAKAFGRNIRRRIGSNNGRGPELLDGVLDENAPDGGIGVTCKGALADADKEHKAIVLTTSEVGVVDAKLADLQAAHAAGARYRALIVETHAHADGVRIDLDNLRWQVLTPQPLMGLTMADLLARSRGRGRPAAGEVLPAAWATMKKTDCPAGSVQISLRVRSCKEDGWQTGNLADLHASLRA